jgi:hypothetical protein
VTPSITDRVRVWERLQRIETRLVQNGARHHRDLANKHLEQFQIPRQHARLLARVGSGLPPQEFTAAQYRARYPFGSPPAIQDAFDALVGDGLCESTGAGYRWSTRGVAAVSAWIGNMGEMISRSQPAAIDAGDVRRLLQSDREILAAMQRAARPHGKVVFNLRREGLQPDYLVPQLWHHWQLAWSMIALHEDEEELVRRQAGLDPLVWWVRRALWLADRRPWLARARTGAELARRVVDYCPVQDAEAAVDRALAELSRRGEVCERDGHYRLSVNGLAATDRDERRIDQGFLSTWPAYDPTSWRELGELVNRLDQHLDGTALGTSPAGSPGAQAPAYPDGGPPAAQATGHRLDRR